MKIGKMIQFLLLGVVAVGFMGVNGCKGTLKGTVTNKLTSQGVEGVTVTLDPAVEGVPITTDASGAYKASIPEGSYTLTFSKTNYKNGTVTADVKGLGQTTADAVLEPTANVVVTIDPASQEGTFGGSAALQVSVDILDGSTLSGVLPEQTGGPKATLTNITQGGFTVQLATYDQAKAALLESLKQPDRFQITGINPDSLFSGKETSLKVTATTSSGTYSATAVIELPLELETTTGIPNVPINVPVLLHGKKQDLYSWSITGPSGSTAALEDATTADPYFTPDKQGEYTVTEADSKTELKVYAGTWAGGITGQDASGNPVMGKCTGCHSSTATFSDKFETWAASGHAHIFSDNINTSTHYSADCLSCHTVGFDLKAANNGADDQSDYQAFVDSGLLQKADPTNWATVLSDYPKFASLTNIQCENCHGPNNSPLHPSDPNKYRNSISSDVCGSCHGEPPRHGRFQQWQESSHANFVGASTEGAVESEGANAGNCGRCHAGQGFLAWINQADPTKVIQGANGNATVDELAALGLTEATAQPQTCVVCHDPHDVGTTSGDTSDATVRITGDTPMLLSGFTATNAGRGAICYMCHNSRRGLRNDANPPTSYGAPHEPTQADMLMGQNVFFVTVGQRSKHAGGTGTALPDSCVTCHMDKTPPPPEYSYQLAGTNHTFKASISICVECHPSISDGTGIQSAFETAITSLEEAIETAAITKLNGLGTIKVRAMNPDTEEFSSTDAKVSNVTVPTATNKVTEIEVKSGSGQIYFLMTLTTPIQITYVNSTGEATGTVTTNKFGCQLQSLDDSTDNAVYAFTSDIVKACWNYLMLEQDLSKGVHNPSFETAVIAATIAKVKATGTIAASITE